MGPYEYEVASIDGDYAVLRRTDNDTHDEILVARALLPEEIDIGTALHYEMFTYSIVYHLIIGKNSQIFFPLIWVNRSLNSRCFLGTMILVN